MVEEEAVEVPSKSSTYYPPLLLEPYRMETYIEFGQEEDLILFQHVQEKRHLPHESGTIHLSMIIDLFHHIRHQVWREQDRDLLVVEANSVVEQDDYSNLDYRVYSIVVEGVDSLVDFEQVVYID